MAKTKSREHRQMLLYDVSWRTYSGLLKDIANQRLRLTYDRGRLEIMILSLRHERYGRFLGRMILVLSEELQFPILEGGSTTFRRRKKQKGLEPDDCFWIQHEAEVRGKNAIDLRTDPPPDLALEVDITQSSLDRMSIYRTLRVPEVWRFDGTDLTFLALEEKRYVLLVQSKAIPNLAPDDLMPFLNRFDKDEATAIIRDFRVWVRQKFQLPQA